ncbi:hypothetical protein M0R45_025392 [Rubus argutus]|uniref:Uncharacterized protein n=1 Tax=Rubus argutus TaxID=59490 RepID=A0AAW1WUK3_RUBAR
MTSKEVKNKVRDSVERGFDKLHRITDTVAFGLAPIDGAIHGVARGIFNWLTDQHPQERTKDCKDGEYSKPGFGGGGRLKSINIKGNGIRGNKGKNLGIHDMRNDHRKGGSNYGDDDDVALNIENNRISDNEADDVGISKIGYKN